MRKKEEQRQLVINWPHFPSRCDAGEEEAGNSGVSSPGKTGRYRRDVL